MRLMSSTLTAVTDETFSTEIAPDTGFVAVEFSAEWCAPCRILAPVVEAIARDYAPRLRVFEMDSDENPRTTVQFGVRSIPTLLLFRDGELVDRVIGAVPAPVLRARLNRIMGD